MPHHFHPPTASGPPAPRARCARRRPCDRWHDAAIVGRAGQDRMGRRRGLPCPPHFARLPRFDGGGALVTPGPGRLPHPPRLRRPARQRVRDAARRRQLRRSREGRRRHRLVGARHARSRRRHALSHRPRRASNNCSPTACAPSRSSRATASRSNTSASSCAWRGAWARRYGVTVRTTFLGAHALPPEYAGRSGDYIELVCNEMLPALAAEGLVDAVDVFCERIAFSLAETERVFQAAQALGLPVKLHAEQLSDMGGAALAARYGALSCDHIEHLSAEGIARDARCGHASPCCCPAPTTRCATRICRRSRRCARPACRWPCRPTTTPAPRPR